MKLRNTAIALGLGAATAAGLSLLKVDKPIIVGSTAVVVAGGLLIARRNIQFYLDRAGEKFDDEDYEGSIKDLPRYPLFLGFRDSSDMDA